MNTVAIRLFKFGAFVRKITYVNPLSLSLDVKNLWITAITAPSNSVDPADLIVIGLKAFQKIVSQTFVAMNKEIPEPKP